MLNVSMRGSVAKAHEPTSGRKLVFSSLIRFFSLHFFWERLLTILLADPQNLCIIPQHPQGIPRPLFFLEKLPSAKRHYRTDAWLAPKRDGFHGLVSTRSRAFVPKDGLNTNAWGSRGVVWLMS